MIYENNAELRALIRRGVASDTVHELLNAKSFVLADVDFDAALAEVKAQHASHTDAEAEARAAYRLLTKTRAAEPTVMLRHSIFSKHFWTRQRVWACLRVAWAIAVLATLLTIAARPARGQDKGYKSLWLAPPDVPPGLIVQVQNQGSPILTRPAGILIFNCSTNLTCSASGSTVTMTASGGSGGASAWSSITNPTANLSLTMAANTSLFTFSAATGAGADLFKWTDAANNTGTGALGHFTTASGSAALPIQFDANGNGLKMNTGGRLVAVGTGSLDYAALANFPAACGANNFATQIAAAPGCAQPGFSNLSGTIATSQFANQNANLIFAGPASGSAAAPSFRASVPADINLAVNAQTGAGYTIVSGDQCKLVTFSNAAAQTVNLPGTVPPSGWCVFFQNTGAGVVTLSPNGHNLDSASASLTLDVHDGLMVVTDGSNYFSMGGAGRRTTVTTGTTDCLSNFTTAGCTNVGTTETAFASSYTVKNGAMFTGRVLNAQFCLAVTTPASTTGIQLKLRWGGVSGTVIFQGSSAGVAANQSGNADCITFAIYGQAAAGASANTFTARPGIGFYGFLGTIDNTAQPVAVATNADAALALTITYANTTNNEKVVVEGAKFWWDN